MPLAVIILNWNSSPDTIRCAQAVEAWQALKPTIWIVDNDSHDKGADRIARECPQAHLIHNPTNLGFAGGNNRGIVQALSTGDGPVLLLNNDASIEEKDITRLIDTLQSDERLGIIGPLIFDADRKGSLLSAGGRDIARHINSHICQVTEGEPIRKVDYVPGTVALVQADVFRVAGLFDEDYFFSGEVADFCGRARQHGYASAVDTRARAFHNLSRSSNFRETLHTYYIIRNRFLFIRKFYHHRRVLFYGLWTLYSLAVSLKAQLSGKSATAQSVWLGLLDGLRGRFGGQNERVMSTCSGSTTPT